MFRILTSAFILILPLFALAQGTDTIRTNHYSIAVNGDMGGFNLKSEVKEITPGLELVTIKLNTATPGPAPKLTFSWEHPLFNVAGLWTAEKEWNKELIWDYNFTSRLATYAPVATYFSTENANVHTFAASDAINSLAFSAKVNELNGKAKCSISIFPESQPKLSSYEFTIRLDQRNIPYFDALKDVSAWWAEMSTYTPDLSPAATKKPMYSTWYSFHSDISPEKVIEQCKLSQELGCKTVLIDDGWQCIDNKVGYTYAGDWNPGRISDPVLFSKQIHDLGMNVIYWYAVPFIGQKSENYERFKGKYLYKMDWNWADVWVLDPRFPEVREFLIEKYVHAVKDWGLDGLKLDFIDDFVPGRGTVMEQTGGRDFASIDLAADRLMTDIKIALKKINPNTMIEFRQRYTGPAMRKYGNMFRAHDCANSFTENRVLTLDLRLIAGETAVHSDMLTWNYKEPVESAALQLLNVLFSVPQISVRLEEIPLSHKKMLKFWMSFWNRHSQTLLAPDLQPLYPEKSYPIVYNSTEKECVIGLYQSHFIVDVSKQNLHKDIYIINASQVGEVTIKATSSLEKKLTIYDCQGNLIIRKRVTLKNGFSSFDVPSSGLLVLSN